MPGSHDRASWMPPRIRRGQRSSRSWALACRSGHVGLPTGRGHGRPRAKLQEVAPRGSPGQRLPLLGSCQGAPASQQT
ncbi:unnamed protein product [Symbiodinium sp. CCMP2456]|nr:unnamed protein product [Symbiodinium sp. CCMP2456]